MALASQKAAIKWSEKVVKDPQDFLYKDVNAKENTFSQTAEAVSSAVYVDSKFCTAKDHL